MASRALKTASDLMMPFERKFEISSRLVKPEHLQAMTMLDSLKSEVNGSVMM